MLAEIGGLEDLAYLLANRRIDPSCQEEEEGPLA